MQTGWASLLWFFAIVALIPVALWLLKRTPLGGASFGAGARAGVPRAVAVLPLSAQHKVVTMEVGAGDDRLWLVVGVSPQGLRTLHTMAAHGEPADAHPPAAPNAAFAQLLSRLRTPKSDKDEGSSAP